MSLIQCPECGRENVSDKAHSCPGCGYPISEYIDEEEKKKRFQALSGNLRQKLNEIDNLPYPDKPNYLSLLFKDKKVKWILVITIASLLLTLILEKSAFLLAMFAAVSVFTGLLLIFMLITYLLIYKDKLHIYREQTNNWEHTKQIKKDELINYYKNYDRTDSESMTASHTSMNIKCPVCNSSDIRRLSPGDRALSILFLGLTSEKIGKQYVGKRCKYLW